jgi:hypothetical protein
MTCLTQVPAIGRITGGWPKSEYWECNVCSFRSDAAIINCPNGCCHESLEGKATIYLAYDLGDHGKHWRDPKLCRRAVFGRRRYAQYDSIPFVSWVEPRKRNGLIWHGCDHDWIVIVEGHNNYKPEQVNEMADEGNCLFEVRDFHMLEQ